jgi:alkanesulfonate monooxygenase SsuD/methylene tetrahydromethanopterin reductase-like flavin-dependent oxidoreductase (luciferase family)
VPVTKRATIGLMVGANTFRNPALATKMVTTLDHMSGGRAVLGIGAAWFETEHTAFGIDFGSGFGERLDWLDEAVEIMHGMLRGETPNGRDRYRTREVRNDPLPLQEHLPILIGGSGEKKTLRTVARFADAWNVGGSPEKVRHKDEVLRRWCEEVGRDESEIERTLMGGAVILRDTVEEAKRVAVDVGRHNRGWEEGPETATTPEALAEELAPYLDLGFRHIYIDFPAPFDAETMERFVTEVRPRLEERAATAV